MKILEITAFSAGFCGLWTRVRQESLELSKKGHKVYVFSSDVSRGCGDNERAKHYENIRGIEIYRFKPLFNFGENTFFWDFEKKALELKPDIIITHAYRQYYSTLALKVARKLGIPCILVTHAPFLEKKLRNWRLNLAVFIYDNFIGKRIINRYSKIFAITKWEYPYLLALGAEKSRLLYVPNGIPEEFFKLKIKTPKNKVKRILFLGRIAPIKDAGTLVKAFSIVKKQYPDVEMNFVGPIEGEYGEMLSTLIRKLDVKVNFLGAIYDLRKKIRLLDSSDIFILPSKREGMPQALIEAMARKKLVISSNTDGGKEIVKDMKTGMIFDIGNEKQLAEKIILALNPQNSKKIELIKKNALNHVKQFSWPAIANKIEGIIMGMVK